MLRSRRDWNVEHAGVFSIVQNSDVRGVRIFRGLVCHHATGVIIFLEIYRVGCAHYKTEPAPFRHSAGNEKTGVKIAAHGFAWIDQPFLSHRLTITQAPDIAP